MLTAATTLRARRPTGPAGPVGTGRVVALFVLVGVAHALGGDVGLAKVAVSYS